VATNPNDERQRYSVWLIQGSGADVESEAHAFVELALLQHKGLTLTDQGPTSLADKAAYELRFVYLNADPPAALMRGVGWLAIVGDTVLAVTYEASDDEFERSLQRFRGLAASVGLASQ
jgi:hypothetical protein